MGGGVGVSVHGACRVACEQTLFAMPETAIGFFPDVGGSWVLPRLGHRELGTYLALTGTRLKGRDVVRAGIATHYVSQARFPELEAALCATHNTAQVAAVLAQFASAEDGGKSIDLRRFDAAVDLAEISRVFAFDRVEDIVSALLASGSSFAEKTRTTLASLSPTALKLTLRLMRLGSRSTTLAECLEREYALTQRCMLGHDFFEGVRALLIDKDQTARWSPRTLEGVSDQAVEAAFVPLQEHRPWRPDILDARELLHASL
jgi:3-hydroxyisobutyryl-CoA hydrolase